MKNIIIILASGLLAISASCKKKKDAHVPPDVAFKTTAGYTFADGVKAKQDTLLVGIIATKTEDDLKSYNVSHAYDGASSTTTFFDTLLTSSQYEHYEKDLHIVMRNQAGTERLVFSIVDRDGNITQKSFTLTVQ